MAACSAKEDLADRISFMPNQAATLPSRISGTQRKPAFCIQYCVPSAAVCACPPNAPNKPTVTTTGTRNCMTLTPRLPSPALRASALPFSALGKK